MKTLPRLFKLGLIINPFAGIGGALALKGSDGADIRQQALAAGAEQKAMEKTSRALELLQPYASQLHIITAAGDMGEALCQSLGFTHEVCYVPQQSQTEATDTQQAAASILSHQPDVILFAGGDGTARNVYDVVGQQVPVVGVPAGCKIHSGVYAVTPSAAGEVLRMMISGEIVSEMVGEVRDIDEVAFRAGKVVAKHFGDMRVPQALQYIQAVKMGGKEDEGLVLTDIAAYVVELMQDFSDHYFVMGSGSTVASVMDELGCKNSLLGVDLVHQGQVVASDMTAAQLISLTAGKPTILMITVIGGQGHLFGRGNQQLSPAFLSQLPRENIWVLATKNKLNQLRPRPLRLDTSDPHLDQALAGFYSIITGYRDRVLYAAC